MDFWLVLGLLQTQHVSQTLHTLLDHSIAAGREAGDTYSKLAEVHVKQDGKADAAQAYVEASKAYQRVDKSSMQAFPSCSSLLTHQCQCMEACLVVGLKPPVNLHRRLAHFLLEPAIMPDHTNMFCCFRPAVALHITCLIFKLAPRISLLRDMPCL